MGDLIPESKVVGFQYLKLRQAPNLITNALELWCRD